MVLVWSWSCSLTACRIMNGSRVTQCLDSLWFYTNILTNKDDSVPSLTHQFEPLIHAKECPKSVLHSPNTPFLVNQQHESQNLENLSPTSSTCEEVRVMGQSNSEKRERRKRRKWNKMGISGINLGFDVKEVSGFLKFKEESYKYHMLNKTQHHLTKMPPFDDDVAMKQHLKSWAYAVACNFR